MIEHKDKTTGKDTIFVGPKDIEIFLHEAKRHFYRLGVEIDGVDAMPGSDAMQVSASDIFDKDIFNSSYKEQGVKYGIVGAKLTHGMGLRYMGTDPDSKENSKIGRFATMAMFNTLSKDHPLREVLKKRPELHFSYDDVSPDTNVVLPWQVYGHARRMKEQGGEIYIPEFSEYAITEREAVFGDLVVPKRFLGFQHNRELAKLIQQYCTEHNMPMETFFGEWRGGTIQAYAIADYLNGKVVSDLMQSDVWIDGVVDTGNTLECIHEARKEGKDITTASIGAKLGKFPEHLTPDVNLIDLRVGSQEPNVAEHYWTVSPQERNMNGYTPDNINQAVDIKHTLPEQES